MGALICALGISAFGCDDPEPLQAQEESSEETQEPDPDPDVPDDFTDPEYDRIMQLKADAVEILTIGPNSFILEARLNRDFFPTGGPMSEAEYKRLRGLCSHNSLRDVNNMEIPYNISLVIQYVFYDDVIWKAEYEDRTSRPNDVPIYSIGGRSWSGPFWEPGSLVDVMAEVHDSETGMSYHIICKDCRIGRTA